MHILHNQSNTIHDGSHVVTVPLNPHLYISVTFNCTFHHNQTTMTEPLNPHFIWCKSTRSDCCQVWKGRNASSKESHHLRFAAMIIVIGYCHVCRCCQLLPWPSPPVQPWSTCCCSCPSPCPHTSVLPLQPAACYSLWAQVNGPYLFHLPALPQHPLQQLPRHPPAVHLPHNRDWCRARHKGKARRRGRGRHKGRGRSRGRVQKYPTLPPLGSHLAPGLTAPPFAPPLTWAGLACQSMFLYPAAHSSKAAQTSLA